MAVDKARAGWHSRFRAVRFDIERLSMQKHFAALLVVAALAACSTEGKVTPLTGASGVPLPEASTWALSVTGCKQRDECEDVRTSLTARLIGAGLAQRIAPAGQPADLSLDVAVERIRSVSGAERVFFGAMAGRNVIASTDTLRDRTGAVLRSFKVESASAAHPFSGKDSLSEAYRQYATDTVNALR